jgi:hypothetical protein
MNPIHPKAEILADIRRLLNRERFAVLATTNGRKPHASIVAFAAADEGAFLVFLTPRRSLKYGNIRKNPNVSLVIDSRPRSGGPVESACGLSVTGSVRPVSKEDLIRFREAFFLKHPGFRRYGTDPGYALLAVTVTRYFHTRSVDASTAVDPQFLRSTPSAKTGFRKANR